MQVYASIKQLPREDVYMFDKLFSSQEVQNARWFITHLHDQHTLVELVEDMGGDASMVRSHPDTADTFFYAIV